MTMPTMSIRARRARTHAGDDGSSLASITLGLAAFGPISAIPLAAAWPPLALLLTVELISRVPSHRRCLAVIRPTATAAALTAWLAADTGAAAVTGSTESAIRRCQTSKRRTGSACPTHPNLDLSPGPRVYGVQIP
jgi:hypothetical protein